VAVASKVQVYNLALNAVGSRSNISSPTENSREAEVCDLWFELVRDTALASAAWPEATKLRYLALSSEQEDDEWIEGEPKAGYQYLYARPSDMLRPQYMSGFGHFLMTDLGFHSNTYQAALVYTSRLTDVSQWGAQLQMAIVYGLAAHICMPLSGKPSRAKMLVGMANELMMAARESAANQNTEVLDSVPDWITARGYTDASSKTRYFYPYGSLLSLPNVN
jgi:hypothetical protein